ncbi:MULTISPECIES: UDP-3-O-acyl-N-acetylglucosamine deacetylase [Dialister]|uniref:UDP-3-O-acyl-N-acetylglucosamine deacetylase n=1 Tax=Dialister hominis TaxID=2582419 RepID=A0A8D5A3H2_9FIRM|nr:MULTISPECIES: UDP-3-O-acyl-N-acetylglucosamine deacetylase [Dialister]MBS6413131.1 UDP-3-O-[3-hydroxymyristoyl] N-acetylglucosamine deacetylase [Dialister sp.]UYJ17660.1 MAG: UDP-3-O-acyl-N-acetylglucosamine deacetylase [Veillonellaceae bacterium]BBK25761.1 UDP-3-O-acyl-N-acetylglucosamine deacetylase [Dialister hominis]
MKRNQHTIGKDVTYKGLGLHSGMPVTMTMHPAAPGAGIIFKRSDLPGGPEVPAQSRYITNTLRATTLEKGEAKVFTVEHVLSALYALQIDNCVIEMDSPEPPVGDGSAKTFCDMVQEAGIETQDEMIPILTLDTSAAVYEDNKFITALPYDGLRITFTSINPHPLLGTQMRDVVIDHDSYMKEIAPARTIGFTWELEAMRKMGLGKGGTLENAVVYSETECLSQLRFPDELVRHKILDILGDISLVGPLHAHIIAVLGSHKLNAELSEKLQALKKDLKE